MLENLTAQERDGVKAAAILMVILYAGLIYYNYQILGPEMVKNEKLIAASEEQIKEREQTLSDMNAMAANMEEVRRKQALLAEVVKRLPKSADPQGFYQALEPVLEATQFEYTELQPQVAASRATYTEIPYRIIGKSRYHDFGQFLNMIEENRDRLMRVKGFAVRNQPDRPSIHPLNVDVASFMFNQKG